MSTASERLDQHLKTKGKTLPVVTSTNEPAKTQAQIDEETRIANIANKSEDDLGDDVILRNLQKKYPERNLTSLDDFIASNKPAPAALTPEQIEAEKKKKRSQILQYGLANEIVNPDILSAYERESQANAAEMYYPRYLAEFRENLADDEKDEYTDDDIRREFEAEYGLTAKEGSAKQKVGAKKLEKIKADYLNETYSEVIGLDKNFETHQETLTKAQQYKGVVEDAFAALPEKLTYKVKGLDIPFQPTKETVAKVRDMYLNETAFNSFKHVGLTKEAFTEAITMSLATLDLPHLLNEVSDTYFAAKSKEIKMGRQGIVDSSIVGEGNQSTAVDTVNKNAAARLDQSKKNH